MHDLFGGTVTVSGDQNTAVCQRRVTRATSKVLETRWKIFRRCKKTEFTSISDDPTLITTCLGPPQPDSSLARGKIAKKEKVYS